MKKQKILITQEFFPPDVVGGGEKLFLKLALMLKKEGCEVQVLCTGDPSKKTYQSIKTIRIPINRYLMNILFPVIAWQAKDVDIIQTASGNMAFPSWLAGKLLRKPVVLYVHHIAGKNWKYIRGPVLGSIFQLMEKLFIGRSYDIVIFQNKHSESIGKALGINDSQIKMVTPGIDSEDFGSPNSRREKFVLFVGSIKMSESIAKVKGLDFLLAAAVRMPDVKFIIVGGGNYLKELRKNSPKNVKFTGPLTGNPLISLYKKASVFCLPSISEGFGITILEAMAAGCPIVSTVDIGQKGYMIKPKNVEEIVRGIKFYLGNPKTATSHGMKNRELSKNFTWHRFINSFARIYEVLNR